jgi:hypothetical protein
MEPIGSARRRSLVGPLILISVGLLFLMFNFVPDFDPWPVLARFWPLLLIFLGLGKLWDYYGDRQHPEQPRPAVRGTSVALVLLFLLLVAGAWHGRGRYGRGPGGFPGQSQNTQTLELQGAKSVSASLEMPSGTLTISSDDNNAGTQLMNADFRYGRRGQPHVDYTVSGDHGELKIAQDDERVHVAGRDDSDWDLRFGKAVPLALKIELGAGQGDLRLNGMDVNRLDVEVGAGELNLDLTGARKSNLTADIEGGAGTATIRLPKDVGVQVNASGGIGSITTSGLKRDGDTYVNDAYGKTATSIEMKVEGGVGQIRLSTE